MSWQNWPEPSTLPILAPNGKRWNFLIVFGDDWPLETFTQFPTFNTNWASGFITFANAVSESPVCFASRAAYQTGESCRWTEVPVNNNGAAYEAKAMNYTLSQALLNAGYKTAWFGKIYNELGESGGWGTLPWFHPGIVHMQGMWGAPSYFNWDELTSAGTTVAHGTADTNAPGTDYATDFEREAIKTFLDGVGTQPWYINWATKACHIDSGSGGAATPPSRYAATSIDVTLYETETFGVLGSTLGIPNWADNEAVSPWDAAAIADIRSDHLAALRTLRALDDGLNAVLAKIEALGMTQNTIVMICCDNARAYGELRFDAKGVPHKSGTDMLLRVKVPGITGGVTRYAPVCNYDIAPTLYALSGAKPLHPPFGQSFHPVLADSGVDGTWREAALLWHPSGRPKFTGLKFGGNPGRVHYRIIQGSGNNAATGGWTNEVQSTNATVAGDELILAALEAAVA